MFIDDFSIDYLDNILVFSRTWEEHVAHVRKVVDVLRRENLYVKMAKCDFSTIYLVYLGHIIGGGHSKVYHAKVEAIVN